MLPASTRGLPEDPPRAPLVKSPGSQHQLQTGSAYTAPARPQDMGLGRDQAWKWEGPTPGVQIQ